MKSIELIKEERKRQIEVLKWDYANDSLYSNNELAVAGATYALLPNMNEKMLKENNVPILWPWGDEYFKPTKDDRIRELVKAGALIAAQIDLLINNSK